MSRTRMTPEDLAWLESRLGESAVPVTPRPDYVSRTKRAVLEGKIEDQEANTLASAFVITFLAAGALATAALTVSFLIRHRRRR